MIQIRIGLRDFDLFPIFVGHFSTAVCTAADATTTTDNVDEDADDDNNADNDNEEVKLPAIMPPKKKTPAAASTTTEAVDIITDMLKKASVSSLVTKETCLCPLLNEGHGCHFHLNLHQGWHQVCQSRLEPCSCTLQKELVWAYHFRGGCMYPTLGPGASGRIWAMLTMQTVAFSMLISMCTTSSRWPRPTTFKVHWCTVSSKLSSSQNRVKDWSSRALLVMFRCPLLQSIPRH